MDPSIREKSDAPTLVFEDLMLFWLEAKISCLWVILPFTYPEANLLVTGNYER